MYVLALFLTSQQTLPKRILSSGSTVCARQKGMLQKRGKEHADRKRRRDRFMFDCPSLFLSLNHKNHRGRGTWRSSSST